MGSGWQIVFGASPTALLGSDRRHCLVPDCFPIRQNELMFRSLLLGAAILAVAPAFAFAQGTEKLESSQLNIDNDIEAIDNVWSGHRVNAQIIQRGSHQFVAYYDASRQMSIAHRVTEREPWRFQKLPSFVGWDSHNYVTVDVDEAGYIHVLGNMHADPLVYFRSREPWNIRSLEKVEFMIDRQREQRVTYPNFLHDRDGRLIAIYRLGGSGNGRYYYHLFDSDTKTWSLLHNGQFFDGEDERGAYYVGPIAGPDGMFHIIWVWRETPSAATNNNLSYVRSQDLVHWENSNGNPVTLPLIRATGEVIDPVPPFGGILNGQKRIGFDADALPMISYYRNDKAGDTQIMLARKDGEGWSIHQVSDWTGSRQNLDRGGSLSVDILVQDAPYVAEDGSIRVRAMRDGERYEFIVDPETNETTSIGTYVDVPHSVRAVQNNPVLEQYVRRAEGVPADSAYDYYLSWEANPSNQDQARSDIPAPSTLRVHRIAR